jgi:prevent-host-death family protein
MTTISKRELNQQTAAVLARVTDTEDVVVTERGVPRWRVISAREPEDVLARLERQGRFTPARSTPSPWPSRVGGPAYTTREADALLAEMRGEH